MDIIKAGLGIGKTIKNVGRLREIISVFARHGFDEFISLNVISKVPNFVLPKSKIRIREELLKREKKDWNYILGLRLRECFEELGPTFIKLGQLLSSREDIFEQPFIDEMKKLKNACLFLIHLQQGL
jgi:ubiquinone biosynthesis protein